MNRSRITGDLVSQNNIFVDIDNDRVGIGITTPGEKLSLPDSAKIALGNSADLSIYHDGTNSNIANTTNDLNITNTGDDIIITANDDINLKTNAGDNAVNILGGAAVELYYNASKKFETYSGGVQVTGNMYIPDGTNSGGYVGLGNAADLRIYHDGSTNIIDATGHNLEIRHSSEKMIVAVPDGTVELYHDLSLIHI